MLVNNAIFYFIYCFLACEMSSIWLFYCFRALIPFQNITRYRAEDVWPLGPFTNYTLHWGIAVPLVLALLLKVLSLKAETTLLGGTLKF